MKIVFKERRISVKESDKKAREEIAIKALAELKDSKYSFSVTSSKTKDNYADVEIGTLTLEPSILKDYFTLEDSKIKL